MIRRWEIRKISSQSFFLIVCIFILLSVAGLAFTIKPSGKYRLDFFTKHNQFYLCDSAYKSNTGSNTFWTPEAYHDRLGVDYDILGIGIESYGHVKADLEILDSADPQTDFGQYNHVVEAGITIQSGLLQVLNFPDYKSYLKLIIKPGKYRVRVYSSGLGNVDTEADEGQDHYKITMWPDSRMERKVLKQLVKK
ncbi:hypothetical protein SAMN05428975_5632 [Mucilaginibacter sp. OK268]|uniref:hypothetical protein n=1 Tax=Mucilaginibacter sp. OK268 TaxID=1881048 RepID=UPI00088A3253|nr:hypothetical protein [Mucilaginibacter sp. OK268]SDQ01183.1 hypothetical protein SAMN05428975_5632 [Mucilaginibacter sp. OK268]